MGPHAHCVLTAALLACIPCVMAAQEPVPTQTPSPGVSIWHATAGYNTFSLRDIARTGPPVDGSPVRWIGAGPLFAVDYERSRPDRVHLVGALIATDGHFEDDSGIGRLARPSSESAAFLALRYGFIRYPARLARGGISIGAGVGVGGERRTIARAPVSLAESSGSVASLLAVRVRRWNRVHVDAQWHNALRISRMADRHVSDPVSTLKFWGGGWTSEWSAVTEVPISPRAAVQVAYTGVGFGSVSAHRGYSVEGRRIAMGLAYAR